MAAPEITDADLDAIAARNDPADIPALITALRAARADVARPLRIEAAWNTLTTYLRRIDLMHIDDSLIGTYSAQVVDDCRVVALRLGLIREARTGRLDLTKLGVAVAKKP